MKNIKIRRAKESDVAGITELFYKTIQTININDYPQDQIDDWSSWHKDTDKWIDRINEQYFIIAQHGNIIIGFASLADDGYLDFMFVHKDFQRQGIASALLADLEKKAIDQQNDLVYSDVSITARGFFENKGFRVERQQLKTSRNKALINFRMIKEIAG